MASISYPTVASLPGVTPSGAGADPFDPLPPPAYDGRWANEEFSFGGSDQQSEPLEQAQQEIPYGQAQQPVSLNLTSFSLTKDKLKDLTSEGQHRISDPTLLYKKASSYSSFLTIGEGSNLIWINQMIIDDEGVLLAQVKVSNNTENSHSSNPLHSNLAPNNSIGWVPAGVLSLKSDPRNFTLPENLRVSSPAHLFSASSTLTTSKTIGKGSELVYLDSIKIDPRGVFLAHVRVSSNTDTSRFSAAPESDGWVPAGIFLKSREK